ncbi:PET127-like protein [Ophiocordyceps camponoti-floridani]|uniref:PET127-like protein n=1 Tax=Ophiocordyceps camponoti-floridani TaxID=2030778 RepID=A0A8H4VC66_9HYPO|nr:PET127-like protein [Ophiocordyceps camponoti-floridani]
MSLTEFFNRVKSSPEAQKKYDDNENESGGHWTIAMAGRMRELRKPVGEYKDKRTEGDDHFSKKSSSTYQEYSQSAESELKKPAQLSSLSKKGSQSTPKKTNLPTAKKGGFSTTKRTTSSTTKKAASSTTKKSASSSTKKTVGKKKSTTSTEAKSGAKKNPVNIEVLDSKAVEFTPILGKCSKKIPDLSYDLDRVLFNQGVYHMQDERTGVFNFDPYLASIMPRDEFDFTALGDYITSSKDVKLREMAAEFGMKFCGSTSSLSSILSQFHFLLSAWRPVSYTVLSKSLKPESSKFTTFTRAPAAAFARYKDGVYAIDADKEYDVESILSMLGKSMEKLLTLPKEEFERYRRTKSHQISEEERNAGEAYHYATIRNFLVRSQLDAQDKRLPGTGVFDLKTRAVISIRMDVQGYEKGLGYEIRKRFGDWESFEREYYDMIRSAFLKYSLQVRMGRMDGIFVAFHNTERIFGFQYVSLPEMDQAIHGTDDVRLGDQEFRLSFGLFNELLERATKRFPNQSLRFIVETRETKVPLTYFFAEPVTEEEADRIQAASRPSVEQLKDEVNRNLEASEARDGMEESRTEEMGESRAEDEANDDDGAVASDARSDDAWKELMARVDDIIENDSQGIGSVRDAVLEALENCGLSQALTEREGARYLDHLVTAVTAHLTKSEETETSAEAEESPESQEEETTKSEETETSAEAEESPESQEEETSAESEELSEENPTEPEETSKAEEAELRTEPNDFTETREKETSGEQDAQKGISQAQESQEEPHEPWVKEGLTKRLYVQRLMENVRDKYAEDVWEAKVEELTKSLESRGATMPDELVQAETSSKMDEEGSSRQMQESEGEAAEEEKSVETEQTKLAKLILEARTATDEGEQRAELLKRIFNDLATQSKRWQQARETNAEESDGASVEERSAKDSDDEGDGVIADDVGEASPTSDETASTHETGSGSADDGSKVAEASAMEQTARTKEPAEQAKEKTPEEKGEEQTAEKTPEEIEASRPVMGMYVTIRNKVNGLYVERPSCSQTVKDWSIEYSINEMDTGKARQIYREIKTRRKKIHNSQDPELRAQEWYRMFGGKLSELSQKGRDYRARKMREEAGNPIQVVWAKEPLSLAELGLAEPVSDAGGEGTK